MICSKYYDAVVWHNNVVSGRKNRLLSSCDACDKKIRERGQSIVVAANKLISYGVPQNKKKALPPIIGMEEAEDEIEML